MIPQELVEYIETNVIFKYHQLDTSHDTTHVRQVIANSFQIIQELKDASIDERMVYVVAAYHDWVCWLDGQDMSSNQKSYC